MIVKSFNAHVYKCKSRMVIMGSKRTLHINMLIVVFVAIFSKQYISCNLPCTIYVSLIYKLENMSRFYKFLYSENNALLPGIVSSAFQLQ